MKLKTLEDLIHQKGTIQQSCDPYQLRELAIKWIKEERKHIAEWHLPKKKGELPKSLTSPLMHIGLIDGFKRFFNITEKELK